MQISERTQFRNLLNSFFFNLAKLRSISGVIAMLIFASLVQAAELTVFTVSSKTNIDFSQNGTRQLIASFLVLNPTSGNLDLYLSFNNGCNVTHFRRSQLKFPITAIRLRINGVEQPADLWTRAATDCTAPLLWTPTPAFLDRYQVDVLISWNASAQQIAGAYSEDISVHAFTNP